MSGHKSVDQSASLPVDLVFLGGGVDQDYELARGEVAQAGDVGDDPVLTIERQEARPGDVQVHLHDRLLVDPGSGLAEPGDLSERQHPVLLQLCGFGRRFCPVVGQCERDRYIGHGDEQADIEHPLQQVVQPQREVDDQEDRPDQAAAQQNQQLRLEVASQHVSLLVFGKFVSD